MSGLNKMPTAKHVIKQLMKEKIYLEPEKQMEQLTDQIMELTTPQFLMLIRAIAIVTAKFPVKP